jgi:hypothetical protein
MQPHGLSEARGGIFKGGAAFVSRGGLCTPFEFCARVVDAPRCADLPRPAPR